MKTLFIKVLFSIYKNQQQEVLNLSDEIFWEGFSSSLHRSFEIPTV